MNKTNFDKKDLKIHHVTVVSPAYSNFYNDIPTPKIDLGYYVEEEPNIYYGVSIDIKDLEKYIIDYLYDNKGSYYKKFNKEDNNGN